GTERPVLTDRAARGWLRKGQASQTAARSSCRCAVQIVDPAFKLNDPAIEQVFGADKLATEVVDDEGAVGRLHMQRCLIIFGMGVEAEIKHLARQFAARNHTRSFARHPAPVELLPAEARTFPLFAVGRPAPR